VTVRANWLFLGMVALLYAVVAAVDATAIDRALSLFASIARQVIPVLVLVFVLVFLTNLLIRPETVGSHLGSGAGWRGWMIALAAGIISTGPIFLWYPMLADLREKGMRTAFIATFLSARAIKLALIPLMIFYFGAAFTAVLTAYLAGFSLVAGYLTERAAPAEGNG
jgi:uncharacterized membrane protein YraQ (UPF0718 family)